VISGPEAKRAVNEYEWKPLNGVLERLAGLEPYAIGCLNLYFFTCSRVPAFSSLATHLEKGAETNQRNLTVLLLERFLYPDVAKVEDASDSRRPRVKP
jgi:hypothetical protein